VPQGTCGSKLIPYYSLPKKFWTINKSYYIKKYNLGNFITHYIRLFVLASKCIKKNNLEVNSNTLQIKWLSCFKSIFSILWSLPLKASGSNSIRKKINWARFISVYSPDGNINYIKSLQIFDDELADILPCIYSFW
jgi:hypothetical protein